MHQRHLPELLHTTFANIIRSFGVINVCQSSKGRELPNSKCRVFFQRKYDRFSILFDICYFNVMYSFLFLI